MKKKGSKKRKTLTYKDLKDEDCNEDEEGKTFYKYYGTYRHTTNECTMVKALIRQAKQKQSKHFDKTLSTPNRKIMLW